MKRSAWCASNHQDCLSERSGYLWCTLYVSHTLQSALDNGQEVRIVQIDFSAAFDRVNHQGIHYSSALWVLEVMCYVYWHSFYQTDHSMLWWMVVGVNCLMLCEEWIIAVFLARYCSSCTLRSFFPFWKISWSVMLMAPLWWLLCHPQASYNSRVFDPWPWQGEWVVWPLGNEIECI